MLIKLEARPGPRPVLELKAIIQNVVNSQT